MCVIANKPDRVNKKLTASVSLLSRQNSVTSERSDSSEPSLDSPLRVVVQARTIEGISVPVADDNGERPGV